jgi:hypothetical protein
MSEEDRQQLVSNHNIPAFEIDPRISLDIEYELAVSLGKLVLDSETKNTALLALGHQLRNLANNR